MSAPFWSDDHLTLYGGDCRAVLAELPAESVHCVVTSPPYWGLRDYGTATWEGGDEACAHLVRENGVDHATRSGLDGGKATSGHQKEGFKVACPRCGARRIDSQLGLEPTPEAYVENMVAVFREVRRVLRADGTLWLNLGDSYSADHAQTRAAKYDDGMARNTGKHASIKGSKAGESRGTPSGLKPKDLVGIPWRVAFALQADGWYLRSDIIWSKPNPMPESVTDRPTKAHEYLFLLSKSPRYYFDADAVREAPAEYERKGGTATYTADGFTTNGVGSKSLHQMNGSGRNLRSVWTIATEPYPGAHFATFPRKLVEPCVKAGSPEGGTVLDPFAGSGTTLLVAQALGRRGVGIDLNPDYLKQALARNAQTPLGLVG
jgi:DNA modification methylase